MDSAKGDERGGGLHTGTGTRVPRAIRCRRSAASLTGGWAAARRKSPFMRVMVSMLISFGHASWHSPYSVQLPKCSRSICCTIESARR